MVSGSWKLLKMLGMIYSGTIISLKTVQNLKISWKTICQWTQKWCGLSLTLMCQLPTIGAQILTIFCVIIMRLEVNSTVSGMNCTLILKDQQLIPLFVQIKLPLENSVEILLTLVENSGWELKNMPLLLILATICWTIINLTLMLIILPSRVITRISKCGSLLKKVFRLKNWEI